MVIWIIILIETILIWQWKFQVFLIFFWHDSKDESDMYFVSLVFSIYMFDRYTTSRTSTKDNEIQLRLP